MSECVVRMEMPDWCPCVLAEDNNGWYGPCFAYNGIPERAKEFDECVEKGTKTDWCPIICPLPEGHGELIERQPILQFIEDGLNRGEYGHDQIEVMTELFVAETIVPAEAERSET